MNNDQTADTAASTGPGCIHDDILTLHELVQVIKSHPTQKSTAAAIEAVARIADDLAHRMDAIEAAAAQALHPCEGCGGINAEQLAVIEEAEKKLAKGGALRRALEVAGIVKAPGVL